MTTLEEGSLKFKLLYFFMYGGLGVLAPYVPVFFERLQMSKSQIGFLLMIPSVSSFIFSPPWSMLSDRLNLRCEVMFFALVTSQIMTFSMYFFDAFLSMSLIVMIGSVLKAPLTSLLDSLVIESLVDKTRYGSLRLWGAVSFALTSFLGGAIIAAFGADSDNDVHPFLYVFGLHALFGGLTGLIIFSILRRARLEKKIEVRRLEKLNSEQNDLCDVGDDVKKDREGIPCVEEVVVTGNRSSGASLVSVLTSDPSVGIFLVVVFCSGLGSGVIDGFLFLRLKSLGGSGLVMGVSRAITCIAEVPCFHISGMLQKKLGTWRLLALTQAAFVIRFVYYSLLTEPWAVLPCEVLHGFTFAIMWSTACTYADEISPRRIHSTIQAIIESIHWGLGSGLGALLGGIAYSSYGAVPLFQACSLISLFSTALALIAAALYGGSSPRTRTLNSDIEFTALPVALIDSADDGPQGKLEMDCEPGLTNTIECSQEAHVFAPEGLCTLGSCARGLPVAHPSQGIGKDTCTPHSRVVRPEGNVILYAPVSDSESRHGVDCTVALGTQWDSFTSPSPSLTQ